MPTTPAPTPQQRSGSVFWPLVLGGIAAGVIGFVAAEMDAFGLRSADNGLAATLAAQQDRIAQLEETLQNLPAPATGTPDLPELDALKAELGSLSGTVSTLDERLTALANRPAVDATGEVDLSGYEAQLAELQASVMAQTEEVAAQKAELDRLLGNALSVEQATAEAARQAVLQGALTQITAAITEGKPYAEALTVLRENGVDDIPDALDQSAESGVATLSSLQARFADNARGALGAARSAGAQEGEDGVAGFLRRSLAARSVAPREGSDPDAVLSRAEAALRDGDLGTALTELDTLPAPAQDAMAAWLSDARARVDVRAGSAALSERLTAN